MTHRTPTRQPAPVPLAYRPTPLSGPTCQACTHRSCRTHRAEVQPRLGGRRTEFAAEHTEAAQVQALNPRVLAWYGEATQSYWLATTTGLTEAENIKVLYRLVNAVGQAPWNPTWPF